ncbi:MAG: glutamine synthetase family protein [Desulfurococcaceae archaeon]
MEKPSIVLVFTDIAGYIRRIEIESINSVENIESSVDGSSIPGYGHVEFSDIIVKPLLSSFINLTGINGKLVYVSELYTPSRKRHPYDPRKILEEVVKYYMEKGIEIKTGIELEFYLTRDVKVYLGKKRQLLSINAMENSSSIGVSKVYASLLDERVDQVIKQARTVFSNSNLHIYKIHRENGFLSQYEISLQACDPISIADRTILSIVALREIAFSMGYRANFMPKPFPEDYGNGLHVHISLWNKGKNMFLENNELSDIARYFIGGILEHASSLAAFTNPSINSYRRLIEGYEAPVYIAWGIGNRTTMIRVPMGNSSIEIRNPDPSMNPYLGLSAILMAGITGIEKKIEPSEPVTFNLYSKATRNIKSLPRSLEEALEHLANDHEYLKPVFSEDFIQTYIDIKIKEAKKARSIPTIIDYAMLHHLY